MAEDLDSWRHELKSWVIIYTKQKRWRTGTFKKKFSHLLRSAPEEFSVHSNTLFTDVDQSMAQVAYRNVVVSG